MLPPGRRVLGVTVAITVALMLAGCSTHSALATNTNVASSADRPVVVALGDSIMKGHGLPANQAWPALLAASNDWKLTNLACDGAGFATSGDADDCADAIPGLVSEAIALHPSLILISGSSNDLGSDNSTLQKETTAALKSLSERLPNAAIVGISSIWNDTEVPDQMYTINHQVRTAVRAVHGRYLDIGQPLAGHRSWLQEDDVHPTAAGQRILAKAIAGAIRSLKLSI